MILDELCATTGWHRDHARKALRQSLGPRRLAKPRKRRPPTYDGEVLAALRKVRALIEGRPTVVLDALDELRARATKRRLEA